MALVDRAALIDRLRSAATVAITAPGGYGKSTLIGQLAASLDVPSVRVSLPQGADLTQTLSTFRAAAARSGLMPLAEALEPSDPDGALAVLRNNAALLVAFDDVHTVGEDAADWLASVVADRGLRQARVMLTGRRMPRAIASALAADDVELDADDLRFRRGEVAQVLQSADADANDESVDPVLTLTNGWPAAVAIVARTMARGARHHHATARPPAADAVLRALVRELLEQAGPAAIETCRRAAAVALLSRAVVEALDRPGAYERLLDSGLPLRTRSDGWLEIPDAIREALEPIPPDGQAARRAADAYASRGEIVEALQLLARSAGHERICQLLASTPRDRLQRAGLALIQPIVARVPDATLASQPEALVQLVRAAERQDRLRDEWLRRASVTVAAGSAAWRALEVERALADARLGDLGGGRARVEQVLRDSATEEALTIGRARLARASLLIVADTASSTDQALTDLEVAAAHLRLAGDRAWEADCHQAAGYGCHYTNGRHDAAIEALERSLALRPSPDAGRAEALTYLAEVLIRVGRLEDATVALREARAIANRLGAARAIAYVAWTLADLHAQRRDRRAASAALDEAEAHLAELARSLAEIDFLVDAARIRAVVGDAEGAARDIERAERVARGSAREDVPLMARARYELLFGDPGIALQALGRVDDSAVAYRGERWLRELLRAATYARLGDAERATDSLASARGMVQDEGDPERLSRLEPELLALAARTAPAAPAERLSVTVSMLGRFAVERGGTDVTPPPGRPQMLVKLLALHATLAADEAMELLWPDVDPGTGRARLRNLLNRVRAASGHIVVRGGDALALAPGVIVDAQRFEQAAAKALAARPSERAGLGRAALAWSTGELLPGDRYEDWADVPRERLRRRRLALLDLVADDAAAKGDFDEAARLLDEAIASDPLEGIRYVRLARALLAQGRTRAAMNVAQRGASAADELGTVPSTDLRELISEIARVEGRGAQAGPASIGCRTVGTGFVGQRRARGMAPRSRSGGLVT